MPLYEYACDACGQRFDVIQKFSDLPPEACELCGKGPVQRQLSSPAIQFKGSGWYITDYAQKAKPDGASGEKPVEKGDKGSPRTETTSDSKTESKAESKTESKAETNAPAKSDAKS